MCLSSVVAAGPAVLTPVAKEISFLRKLSAYDSGLQKQSTIRVLVLFDEESAAAAEPTLAALTAKEFLARSAKLGSEAPELLDLSIVFILSAHDLPPSLRIQCERHHVLCVSRTAAHAIRGDVAIALTINESKPAVVNLGRLKAEGHWLSSDVLALVRVIDEGDDFAELAQPSKTKPKRSLDSDPWK